MDTKEAAAPGGFRLTLPRLFWCVFVAALISGFVRLTCLPLFEVQCYGVAAFLIVMATAVGGMVAWEPFALRGAIAMGGVFIVLALVITQPDDAGANNPATAAFDGVSLAPSFMGTVGILFAYFGAAMSLHIRGHERFSTWMLWTPPVAACVISNCVMVINIVLSRLSK